MDRTTLCKFQRLRTKLVGAYWLFASARQTCMHAWLQIQKKRCEACIPLSSHVAHRGPITSPSLPSVPHRVLHCPPQPRSLVLYLFSTQRLMTLLALNFWGLNATVSLPALP